MTLVNTLIEELPHQRKELEKRLDKVENPIVRKYIETLMKQDSKARRQPIIAILYNAITQAIDQNLHQDPEKFFQYIASTLLHTTHEIAKQTTHTTEEHIEKKYGIDASYIFSRLTNPQTAILGYLVMPLEEVEKEVPEARKYREKYDELTNEMFRLLKRMGVKYWNQNPVMAYSAALSRFRGTPHEAAFQKPEEILGIKPEERFELSPEGVRILAEPERYLALTTKILLLLKTLEWRTRRGNRIPRQVYQALRNILETPLLTGNYPHAILPLIERYEKGETPNPLQHILETITQTAENNLTTQIRKTLEKMKPIMEKINRGTPLTPEEKQALNNHIRELQKTLLQAKPEEILEAYHAILLTTQNPSHEEALKTIDGILEDLRQVYTGEKTKQQLDRERDITQIINIYHNLKNVEERAPLYPDQVAELIRTTITENIDDPLTRELYKQAIQHYEQTHQYVTEKPETLLQRLEEKENQLFQTLKERAKEEPRITLQVMASIRNFYRTLILTTPRPTIKETIEFYEKIKPLLKHNTPLGEYTPIHGPVTADLLYLHDILLEKKGKERENFVRTAGSIFSTLTMSSLAMRETAKQILARRQEEEIPIKDHKRFIKQLEYHQVRK